METDTALLGSDDPREAADLLSDLDALEAKIEASLGPETRSPLEIAYDKALEAIDLLDDAYVLVTEHDDFNAATSFKSATDLLVDSRGVALRLRRKQIQQFAEILRLEDGADRVPAKFMARSYLQTIRRMAEAEGDQEGVAAVDALIGPK